MPRGVVKRPAAAPPAGKRNPKVRKVDPRSKPLKEVANALRESQELDETMRSLLSNCVAGSLGAYSDARHEYQVHTIDVIEKSLNGMEKGMQKAVEEAQARLEKQKDNREALETGANEAEAELVRLKEDAQAKEQEVKEAEKTMKRKHTHIDEVKNKGEKEAEKKQQLNLERKASLEKAATELLPRLKENTLQGLERKNAAKQIIPLFKDLCKEETLLECAKLILPKRCVDRTPFDTLFFEHLDIWVSKCQTDLNTAIAEATPDIEKEAEMVNGLQAEADAASSKHEEMKQLHEQAAKALADGKAAAKTARNASSNWLVDLKKSYSEVDAEQAKLKEFSLGPHIAFQQLKSMITPPQEQGKETEGEDSGEGEEDGENGDDDEDEEDDDDDKPLGQMKKTKKATADEVIVDNEGSSPEE